MEPKRRPFSSLTISTVAPHAPVAAGRHLVLIEKRRSRLGQREALNCNACSKTRHSFLDFSYVCPEPVWAKSSFIYIQMAPKRRFSHRSRPQRGRSLSSKTEPSRLNFSNSRLCNCPEPVLANHRRSEPRNRETACYREQKRAGFPGCSLERIGATMSLPGVVALG